MHGVDRAGRRARRRRRAKSAEAASPKRTSLPSMRAARGRGRGPGRGHLGPGEQRDRDAEQDRHHREDRAALAPVADDEPKAQRHRERDEQEQEDLEEVGQRRRVLERVRGVGVVEAATVGAELLDRLLAGDRAAGDVLAAAGERVRPPAAREVLDDAEGDQHERARPRRSAAARAGRRGPGRPRSCRRPSWALDRARPRARATATAMPTAADAKFCTVRPVICNRCPRAASPEYHCQFVLVTNETAVFQAPSAGSAAMPSESGRCCWSRPKREQREDAHQREPEDRGQVGAPVLVGVGVDPGSR